MRERGDTMIKLIYVVLTLAVTGGHALARELARPLGLELGTATCAEVEKKGGRQAVALRDVSSWSGGPLLKFTNTRGFALDGLQHLMAVCDPGGKLLLLVLRFPKGDMHSENVQATAAQLDTKYTLQGRKMPPVGNASAIWTAPNGRVELSAPHLSFSFEVLYWAHGARELFDRWEADQQRKREVKKAGQL